MKNIILILLNTLFLNFSMWGQIKFEYTIKHLDVNSKYSDMGVSFFGLNRVYFASNKNHAKSVKINFRGLSDTYEAPNYDLYKGIISMDGEIEYYEKVVNESVSKYNESNVSFSPDMRHVYFTQNVYDKGKSLEDDNNNVNFHIYRAKVLSNGDWTNIKSLPFNDVKFITGSPSVSEDNKILFFSSNMPGSLGASDIYWVTINEDGTYGTPKNIGNHINSIYRDNFAYVDKNILYFSSDRPGGYGGLDVYMVRIDEFDAVPENLGSPINSSSDDFGFVIDRVNKKGYFTSNRPGGKGGDDIYYFSQKVSQKEECKQVVQGVVYDMKTKEPLPGAIVKMITHDHIVLATLPVKSDGSFRFELACRSNYRIEAYKDKYDAAFQELFFTPFILTQDVDLYLTPKEVPKPEPVKEVVVEEKPKKEINTLPTIIKNNKEILDLPPVYFDLDQYYLTLEGQKIVERAIDIILQQPNIRIEFSTHTDSRASDSYNLHLSDMRAKEVLQFMLDRGVPRERLTARGYGESRPVNHCVDGVECSEREHLVNRRAEFVILKK